MSNPISLSRLVAPFALALGLSVSFGCGGRVEERLNCRNVCNSYEDCVDSDYDSRDCIQRCSSDSVDNDDYSRQVDMCDACINDRSCGESVFACTAECASIVP